MPTQVGNYLIEIDGVALCECQEIDTGGTKHEKFLVYKGNKPNPGVYRGKYTVEPIKIKQARGLNGEDAALSRMFQDFIRGVNLTKPTIRIVTLDENGSTVLATDEYTECVVETQVPDGKKGEGKEADHVLFSFTPTDHLPSY